MSDAASLPETLEDTIVHNSRTRQDNWSTVTRRGNFTAPHRALIDKIDTIQITIDFIKITGGAFTGKPYLANGRPCVTFRKFLINFRSVVFRSIANLPTTINAVELTEAVFYELRPGEVNDKEYVTEFNQLVFDSLINTCDEEALNIVLRYERSDDGQHEMKKDGRRALFALMQTYSPVSTNAGNNAKAKLESTRFLMDKTTINQQITDFHVNVSVLESARDHPLEPLELWAFVTSSIKGADWASFRLTMSMQKEYKEHRAFWFIDQVREYILALEDDETASPSRDRKKSMLNAAQTSKDDLREVVATLAASVAAIVTKAETSSRVKKAGWRPEVERPYDARMGPCRFCGGGHKHRDCPTLKTTAPKPPIPPRVGAVRSANDNGLPGFLMGAVAVDQPACFPITSAFPLAPGEPTTVFNNKFGVDSCASEHICHDEGMFSAIDYTKSKTFRVVHGETITSSGVGNVELLVQTTQGKQRVLTLRDVHYIPQQKSSLISVNKAISGQDFDSPDFKNLTWKADDTCTLKILATNGVFVLDASVRYWSWTKSGVHREH
jgi:hypothetical protein